MNQYGEQQYKYDAFISYRHTEPDRTIAVKLQEMLEKYKVPKELAARNGYKKLHFFRDEDELPTSSNLSAGIDEALEQSRYLICICSPAYLESRWCMQEINQFKAMHGGSNANIIPLVVAGDDPTLVFPEQLTHETRYFTDATGAQRSHEVEIEPLAGNVAAPTVKESLKKLKTEALRIAAPLLGVGFNDLYDRDTRRAVRRRRTITAVAFASMALFLAYSSVMLIRIAKQNKELTRSNAEIQMREAQVMDETNRHLEAVESALRAYDAYEKGGVETDCSQERIWSEHAFLYQYNQDAGQFGSRSVSTNANVDYMAFSVKSDYLYVRDEVGGVYVFDPDTLESLYTGSIADEVLQTIQEDDTIYTLTDNTLSAFDISGQKMEWEEEYEHDEAVSVWIVSHVDSDDLAIVSGEAVRYVSKSDGKTEAEYLFSSSGFYPTNVSRLKIAMDETGDIYMVGDVRDNSALEGYARDNLFHITRKGIDPERYSVANASYGSVVSVVLNPNDLFVNYLSGAKGTLVRYDKGEENYLEKAENHVCSYELPYSSVSKHEIYYISDELIDPDIDRKTLSSYIMLVYDRHVFLVEALKLDGKFAYSLPTSPAGRVSMPENRDASGKERKVRYGMRFPVVYCEQNAYAMRDFLAYASNGIEPAAEKLIEAGFEISAMSASLDLTMYAAAPKGQSRIYVFNKIKSLNGEKLDAHMEVGLDNSNYVTTPAAVGSDDLTYFHYTFQSTGVERIQMYDAKKDALYDPFSPGAGMNEHGNDELYAHLSAACVPEGKYFLYAWHDLKDWNALTRNNDLEKAGPYTKIQLRTPDGELLEDLTREDLTDHKWAYTGRMDRVYGFSGADHIALATGQIYQLGSGERIEELELDGDIVQFDNPAPGVFAAVVRDPEDGSCRIAYDNGDGNVSHVEEKGSRFTIAQANKKKDAVTDVCISEDGENVTFVSEQERTIWIYNTKSDSLKVVKAKEENRVLASCRFSKGGDTLYVITVDGGLSVIDTGSGKLIATAEAGVRVDEDRRSKSTGILQAASDGDLVIYARDSVLLMDTEKLDVRAVISGQATYIPEAERIITTDGTDYYAGKYLTGEESKKAAEAFLKKYGRE